MSTRGFKNCLFFSFAAHGLCIALFAVSFGKPVVKPQYAEAFFLGGLLSPRDFVAGVPLRAKAFAPRVEASRFLRPRNTREKRTIAHGPVKPATPLSTHLVKRAYSPSIPPFAMRRESVLIFYPQLPASFLLYFKDTQQAHIELLCRVDHLEDKDTVTVKRKISSGNLEADLLSMRYLNHYLSLQHARFSPGSWHPVKIDLSPGNGGRGGNNDHY